VEYNRVRLGPFSLYIEGDGVRPEMQGGYMSDDVYNVVLNNTIIVCTDVVIINSDRRILYLAKRVARPMPGLWWIGGRRVKGETAIEGIQRNFRRETGLDLPLDRFEYVTMTEYLWQDREQKPQENGSHNLCHQFSIELTEAELDATRQGLEIREYDPKFGLQEFDRKRLVAMRVHPVIVEVFDTIFPRG